jgi:hypothetical protein
MFTGKALQSVKIDRIITDSEGVLCAKGTTNPRLRGHGYLRRRRIIFYGPGFVGFCPDSKQTFHPDAPGSNSARSR